MLDKEKRIPVGLLTWRSFRDVCVVCFILVVTWKVLNSEISFNVGNLEYSDFLSTAIAFFSIGLSVAFYFKATDTSNQFYDNSYKFTKQISEMLGRIEAGFGEKLTHIDEGYSGLKQKIDQMPFDSVRANEQVREETQKVEQTEEAQKKILEDLAKRAQLAEEEKEALFKKMHAYSVELGQATQNVIELKRHIAEHSGDFGVSNRSLRALAVIASKLAEEPQSLNADLTESQIQKFFRSTKYELPVPMRSQLFSDGLIRADESLSSDAIKIICKFLD